MLSPTQIETTYHRIKNYLHKTPILESSFFNKKYGHRIFFKYEGFQKIGAFKFRGAINALLSYQERHQKLPEKVVAFSSGNHAQAVSLACQMLGVQARIYIPKFSSKTKIIATKSYGAEVILSESRTDAENAVKQDSQNGYYLIHPFDDNDVLLGQGTSCYEALLELQENNITPDAIFATCGGGGWLSGSYLAKELLSPISKIFGTEPRDADDAYRSLQAGHIISLDTPSMTIADGARSTSVGQFTFEYLKKLDGLYTVSEQDIIYHTQWLNHILKVRVEPTSAVTMGGVVQYIQGLSDNKQQNILVLLSGGNIDTPTEKIIWEQDYLTALV
jgi:threonine dehydratase